MTQHNENSPLNSNTDNKKGAGKRTTAFARLMSFVKKHPVLMNFIYAIFAVWFIVFLMLMFMDVWTSHGVEADVPDVKGQSCELAQMTLHNHGFECEVIDSVYDTTHRPGQVLEQVPRPGARVKPGRLVYLTVVANTPKMVTVPDFLNVSRRQGVSMFEALGVANVRVSNVPSPYADLVLGARCNGRPLRPGDRIPVSSTVTVEVGSGFVESSIDDAATDGTGVEDNPNGADVDEHSLFID